MKFQSGKLTLPNGGMHHLGAREEDIAEKVILTCAEEDVPVIASYLENAKETAAHREYLTYKGTKNGKELAVTSVGQGCMPMAIAVEELNHLNVKTIVKTGTGQAILPGIRPGTVIVPSAAVRSEGATKEYVPESYPAVANIPLLRKLVTALKEEGIEPMVGYVRTHDGFYTEQPSDPEGPARIAKWAKLGVLLNEHECSSMFVISEILKLNAAAVIVAEENVADGTALDPEEKKEILDKVYRAVVRVLSE